MLKRLLFAAVVIALMSCGITYAQDDTIVPKDEHEIFDYLDRSVAWYRHVVTVKTSGISTREAYLATNLQQSALKALRYGFDYAHIQADLLETALEKEKIEQEKAASEQAEQAQAEPEDADEADDKGDKPFDAKRYNKAIGDKINMLTADLAKARNMQAFARGRERAVATATVDKLTAELAMAQVQRDLIMKVISTDAKEGEQSLQKQIDNLAASIPELNKTKKTAADKTKPANGDTQDASAANAAAQMLLPGLTIPETKEGEEETNETKGVIGLTRELIASLNRKQEMTDLLSETKQLQDANARILDTLRGSIVSVVKRSNEIAGGNPENAEALNAQTGELGALTDDFKAMSELIIPLGKQKRALVGAATVIANWQNLYDAEIGDALARILGRVLTLLFAIAIPFLLSEVVRRLLVQYIEDARRRRQLNVVRRIVVSIIVALIILLNLISELGSFATFIGFVTAGLAVALQNVILSIVAYFFFFGRYGIKVGSRVTVYGTTGDVIETGLVRLYMMEMVEEKGQYRATGRIVAFPNSILFQPTAFFKQVPGVNYRWHEITFMLKPDTDRALARTKLNEAVESIYNDTKGIIDMQRVALEKSTRLKVREPRPEGNIDRLPEGLSFMIRYPVDTERADEIDKNVTKQITEIFQKLPAVERLNDDPPVIKKR